METRPEGELGRFVPQIQGLFVEGRRPFGGFTPDGRGLDLGSHFYDGCQKQRAHGRHRQTGAARDLRLSGQEIDEQIVAPSPAEMTHAEHAGSGNPSALNTAIIATSILGLSVIRVSAHQCRGQYRPVADSSAIARLPTQRTQRRLGPRGGCAPRNVSPILRRLPHRPRSRSHIRRRGDLRRPEALPS